MAFCTSCGATVNGTFCSNCGTPAAGSAAAAPTGAATAPAAAPIAAMPPAAPRKTSPIVWVLVALGAVFVLFIVGAIGVSALLVHKARQAGFSTELMRKNPAAAVARMAAMGNKDVEIVGEDDSAGTISLRDRKTGKVVTMSFDQVKSGFTIRADGDDGKTAVVQFGGGSVKLPGWIPNYPGSNVQTTFAAKGVDDNSAGQGGNFSFTTSDSPSKVLSFYQDKVNGLGMKVKMNATTTEGGSLIAADEPERRSLTVIIGSSSGQTTVNVTYGEKQ